MQSITATRPEVKTPAALSIQPKFFDEFQFHTGSIKSPRRIGATARQSCFNSTLVRLKDFYQCWVTAPDGTEIHEFSEENSESAVLEYAESLVRQHQAADAPCYTCPVCEQVYDDLGNEDYYRLQAAAHCDDCPGNGDQTQQ